MVGHGVIHVNGQGKNHIHVNRRDHLTPTIYWVTNRNGSQIMGNQENSWFTRLL